ncbi:MAG: hypothetical protein HY606_09950 [Planctomycetes bacterium]|nr:hypothetical protein [Planctomycetota bacterium]
MKLINILLTKFSSPSFFLGLLSTTLLTTLIVLHSKGTHLLQLAVYEETQYIVQYPSILNYESITRSGKASDKTTIQNDNQTSGNKDNSDTNPTNLSDKHETSATITQNARFNLSVKETREQIKNDFKDVYGKDLDFITGSNYLLGTISNAKQITDFTQGKSENPLKNQLRQFVYDSNNNNIVELGPSLAPTTSSGQTSQNTSTTGESGQAQQNWYPPASINAKIDLNTGNMFVNWNGNGMNVSYMGASSLVSVGENSLIYQRGEEIQAVIMGMNDKVEELLIINSASTPTQDFFYQIGLEKWVKNIRLTDDGYIELRDENETRFRIGVPEALDSASNPVLANWAITDIQAQSVTSTSHSGSTESYLITNGISITIKLHVNGAGATYPIVIDPAWMTPSSLSSARKVAGMFQLGNGKILICGGYNGSSILSSSELYNQTTGAWSSGGSMVDARWHFSGAMLSNGKVLVSGGYKSNQWLSATELYDVSADTWAATGSMNVGRGFHGINMLDTSGNLLASGGWDGSSFLSSCELYSSSTWAYTGSLGGTRRGHLAMSLQNSKVLAIGGDSSGAISTCELYNSSTWTTTGSLNTGRRFFSGTMLTDGAPVVMGGRNSGGTAISTCEKYDVTNATWAYTGSLGTARVYAGSAMLINGNILVAGGYDGASYLSSTEIYSASAGTFASATAMGVARVFHGTTIMYDGHIIAVGGQNGGGNLTSCEYYRQFDGTWTLTGSLGTGRQKQSSLLLTNDKPFTVGGENSGKITHTYTSSTWAIAGSLDTHRRQLNAILLGDATVLAPGGIGSTGQGSPLAHCELYSISANTWAYTGSISSARYAHASVLLTGGTVLLTGGYDDTSAYSKCDLYNAATWTLTGSLSNARYYHSVVLLQNGNVLAIGGFDATNRLSICELYNSSTWTTTGSMNNSRELHFSAVLPNGKVIVVGGYDGTNRLSTCELYDTSTATWTLTGSLATARQELAGVVMPNGKVLICGGYDGTTVHSSSELYDPVTGTWTLTGSLAGIRYQHNALVFTSGKMMAIAGYNGSSTLKTIELYDYIGTIASSTQPTITDVNASSSFPVSITRGASTTVTGTNFKGKTEGSFSRFGSSATNFPIVLLQRITSQSGYHTGQADDRIFTTSTTGWEAGTSLTFTAPSTLHLNGHYVLTIVVNGIPSTGKIVKATD